jgi:uncharacterized repeat protein (TIGR01451 family)
MQAKAFIPPTHGAGADEARGIVAVRGVPPGRLVGCAAAVVALITSLSLLVHAPAARAASPIPGSSANCDSFTLSLLGIIDITSFPEPGWVYVDPSQKLKDVSGTVTESFATETDFPAVHDSHDQNTHLAVDPGYEGLLSDINDPGEIEMEWEIGTFPSETSGDPPERTFPRWAWPSVGDRVWMNGSWIFDCGHPDDSLGFNRYHTEIHPPRAIASMRPQLHTLPGTGTTPVPVTATDLYVHGREGFVGDDLACGQEIIVSEGSCSPSAYPHRGTEIDSNYDFKVCLPVKPSANAVLATSMVVGPGNTIGVDPTLTPEPAAGPCTGPGFGPMQLDVAVPLAGTGVTPDDVLARTIYAGWVFPPDGLRHVTVKLTKGVLHEDMDVDPGDCECSFFWLNMDRAGDEWFRLTPYEIPTDDNSGFGCPSNTNTLNDWDDDGGCGDGSLNFSGPTFDFYVAAGQDYTLRTVAYDQDCLDGRFGNFILATSAGGVLIPTLDALALGACFIDPFEPGDNDPYNPATATNLAAGSGQDLSNPSGQFDLFFNVTNDPVTTEDTADLSLIKACKPDLSPARAGQRITCTIVVTNPGPGLPRNVVVRDTLLTSVAPTDYTMDAPTFTFSGSGSSAPCGPVGVIAGGKQFNCDLGTVPVGGSAIVSYHLTSNEGGDFNNFASVTTDSTDPNPNNNSDRSSVHVDPVADLSLDKSDSPDPLVGGTQITYTLHAHNAGPSHAPNTRIRDFLPASVSVVSVNGGAGSSCVSGVPGDPAHPTRCTYATLAPSATATMTLVVRVKPGDHPVVTNQAEVASDVLDPDTSNNSADATTTIKVADLRIVKTSDGDVYKPSAQITYTLTVTNNGPGAAETVVVTDALPLESKDRVSVLDSSCSLTGSVATCNLGTIAPLGTRTVTIAIVPKGSQGKISNTATVDSSTFDPDSTNNTSTRVVVSGSLPKP